MHDLNTAIEAAKSGADASLALPGSMVCTPPHSEFWLRPPLYLRKRFCNLVSLVSLSTKPTCSPFMRNVLGAALVGGS